jgi:hypothetical protein
MQQVELPGRATAGARAPTAGAIPAGPVPWLWMSLPRPEKIVPAGTPATTASAPSMRSAT